MRVLLIEDDPETAAYVARGLREHGHVVDVAATGPDGLFLGTGGHDVLIVDRMLPGLDGIGLVRALRAMAVKTPVLFLTALGGIGDRVKGLEAGGDDYLVKPFAFAELLARVKALARRPPLAEAPTVLRVADLEIDLLRRSVTRGERRIELQPREFQLLEYLHAPRRAGGDPHHAAGGGVGFPLRSQDQHRRDAYEPAAHQAGVPGRAELIHTVRGAGYVVRAPGGAAPDQTTPA